MSNSALHLPVLVGFGGICPAGRSSAERAYERLVYQLLNRQRREEVLQSLAGLTGGDIGREQALLDGTLIRKIMPARFDTENLPSYTRLSDKAMAGLHLTEADLGFAPSGWQSAADGDGLVPGPAAEPLRVNRPQSIPCRSAGQLPEGFAPSDYYPSRQHPLALEMTIFGMSDALGDMGLDWEWLAQQVAPDRIAVISGSALAQIDERGIGNYNTSRLMGTRISSRSLAMGLGEMSADFINAYVLGTQGITGTYTGACATWLYNLSAACDLIRNGQIDLAVVGSAESQVNPWVIEAFHATGAIASDDKLLALQRSQGDDAERVDYRRACRPFADNVGMVVGEAAQFAILMSDRLALQTGADIKAAALSTHIHADGNKYSISSPGAGNYLTLAKTLAETAAIVGETCVRERSVVLAHGTGTPQNRVTESHVLDYCAAAFGIADWPVIAIKSVLGHSMACSSGDQCMAALGVTNRGLLPGIPGADKPADDVYHDHLNILYEPAERDPQQTEVAFMNAKGFGGNNASSALLGRQGTLKLLRDKHGKRAMDEWMTHSEAARQSAADYDAGCRQGQFRVRYLHGENVRNGIEGDVVIEGEQMHLKGLSKPVSLRFSNPFTGDQ